MTRDDHGLRAEPTAYPCAAMSRSSNASTAELRSRLPALMLRDERRLGRRLEGVRKMHGETQRRSAVDAITADIARAELRVANRRAAVPKISYPPELPVSQLRDEILAAIRGHQVVILAGETGSGKTTQLPKICLELGRGVRGMIGHTQPRRLAARTVAERIAEELDVPLGDAVGYTVRFTDHASDRTMVRLMTDGILLAEIQRDRALSAYDTLIIDEAHERSLNVDFILGYLKQLLPRRPDLKVIVTSATIDPARFSRHFDDAPVVEVSGRTYPVEVRYRPLSDEGRDDDSEDRPEDAQHAGPRDRTQAILEAVAELSAEGPGDVLVFLSGEREIRDTADALMQLQLPRTEVTPLYARLSAGEQHRVFQPHTGRRVVLATNVAETSLTVPGIKYVVDPGTARISRYSQRTKVQRLPIEPISQASANQRKGRCGRTSDGICVRLYSAEDYAARPAFTDPEILRTNLASVILAMTSLGLGDLASFPFLDAPDRRNIKDGVQLLHELGAMEADPKSTTRRLTPIGRRLAQIPLDPRLARMVLEADKHGCAREVMVIAAALSIQDPRERPAEKRQAADASHARFADPDSDFLAYLNLWNHLRDRQAALSSNQFRRLCRTEFLNYLRVREWQDVHGQLKQIMGTLGVSRNREPAKPDSIHIALLSGLLSHIGVYDGTKREYEGARNARFSIFPGSALFKKTPRWVMAGELVETSRLWARTVARIEPEWAEGLAPHLVRRSYSEPHWEKKRGAVMAFEKVTLYGLPIVTGRKLGFGQIDPVLSRELFIRHALVEGDWQTRHPFFHENRAMIEEVAELEDRVRRRDLLVDDETLFEFYDERIGPDVVSGVHFDTWWKKAFRSDPELLNFERSLLLREEAAEVDPDDHPEEWHADGLDLPISYAFEPGAEADGVTVELELADLGRVSAELFEWQIPGLREELVTALIRSLPKQLRRNFIPAPDRAREVLARLRPGESPLLEALSRELLRTTGVPVPLNAWQWDKVPQHLRVTFRVVGESGETMAEGKDLEALRLQLKPVAQSRISAAAAPIERSGLREWSIGTLPQTYTTSVNGHPVTGYPALVDEADAVAVRVLENEPEQRRAMWQGTRRLLRLGLGSQLPWIQANLDNTAKLALAHNPHGSVGALLDNCVGCAVDHLVALHGGPAWDERAFAELAGQVQAGIRDAVLHVVTQVARVLALAQQAERELAGIRALALLAGLADVRAQLSSLVAPGFVTDAGWDRLADLARYLRAMLYRLQRLPSEPARDAERMRRIRQAQQAYERTLDAVRPGRTVPEELRNVRWLLEEFRVSLFAQQLGTATPVSEKRILRILGDIRL